MTAPASAWSHLNGWRVLVKLWRQSEPPEFHWRLQRYFCWTRLAVAVLLVGYAWLPLERAAAGADVFNVATNARLASAMPVVLPYLAIALVTLFGTLWRNHFHVRVRVQVLADMVLLASIYAAHPASDEAKDAVQQFLASPKFQAMPTDQLLQHPALGTATPEEMNDIRELLRGKKSEDVIFSGSQTC